jgi:hypothetical protein
LDSYEKSCDTKIGWYPRICEAIHHADSLMDKTTLMKYPEVAYWCKKHRVYHVGRDRFMKPAVRAVYEPAAWARGRALRLQGFSILARGH